MQIRFKYTLLFMMVAGWLMVSCTSNTPYDERSGAGPKVQFAAFDASRSSVSTNLNYAGAQFAVFGDMKFVESPSQKCVVVFDGDLVSYDDSKWTYANTQYWFPKHEHSFVAVHPAAADGVTGTTYSDNSLSFDYTLPDTFRDAPDLLVATHRRMYESGAMPTVMLKFIHALSRVNFSVICDGIGEKIIVKEIRLEGLNKSGTLTVRPAALTSGSKQTDDYDLLWTNARNDKTLVADIDVEVPDGSKRSLFPDNDALFVIPQPDNKGVIMKITYAQIQGSGAVEEHTLAAVNPIGGWKPEKVYTYLITFKTNTIDVNVSVNDWKVGPVDDVQVPRK